MVSLISKIKYYIASVAENADSKTTETLIDIISKIEELEYDAPFEDIAQVVMDHLSNSYKYTADYKLIATYNTVELLKVEKDV